MLFVVMILMGRCRVMKDIILMSKLLIYQSNRRNIVLLRICDQLEQYLATRVPYVEEKR